MAGEGPNIGELIVGLTMANDFEHQVMDHGRGADGTIRDVRQAAGRLNQIMQHGEVSSLLGVLATTELPSVTNAMHQSAETAQGIYAGILGTQDDAAKEEDRELLAHAERATSTSDSARQQAAAYAEKIEAARAAVAAAQAAVGELVGPLVALQINIMNATNNAWAAHELGESRAAGL